MKVHIAILLTIVAMAIATCILVSNIGYLRGIRNSMEKSTRIMATATFDHMKTSDARSISVALCHPVVIEEFVGREREYGKVLSYSIERVEVREIGLPAKVSIIEARAKGSHIVELYRNSQKGFDSVSFKKLPHDR